MLLLSSNKRPAGRWFRNMLYRIGIPSNPLAPILTPVFTGGHTNRWINLRLIGGDRRSLYTGRVMVRGQSGATATVRLRVDERDLSTMAASYCLVDIYGHGYESTGHILPIRKDRNGWTIQIPWREEQL